MVPFILTRVLYNLGLYQLLNYNQSVNLYHKKYCIPLRGMIGYKNLFAWEGWMYELMRKINIKDGMFLDIGVNIGQTLLKVKAVDEHIDYLGIEPNRSCQNYLETLIGLNNMKRVNILPVALSDKTEKGILSLYRKDPTDGMASIVPEIRKHNMVRKEQEIDTIDGKTLLTYIHNKVQTIKIDVEGAELEVLRNIDEIVTKDRPNILIEILPVYNVSNVERLERQEAIEKLLKKWSYTIYLIKFESSKLKGIERKENFGINDDIKQVDYILCPSDKNMSGLYE